MGDEHYDKAASDILFEIREQPHLRFTRKDHKDLLYTMNITMEQALLGFNVKIEHLDGHFVNIKKLGVTIPGHTEKLTGEGMPEHEYSSNFGVPTSQTTPLTQLPRISTSHTRSTSRRHSRTNN